MMNRVDLEGLKPGDEVVAKLRFVRLDAEGAWFEMPRGKEVTVLGWNWDCLSLPEGKPKYDPCRLFKKGDKVRVVEWNGRDIARVGQIGFVVADEKNAIVELSIDGWTKDVFYPACHLELVTPVEELEPYYVGDCQDDPDCPFFFIQHNNNEISSGLLEEVARFVYNTDYTADKATVKKRAEAVRDMLNAEYRKEDKQ